MICSVVGETCTLIKRQTRLTCGCMATGQSPWPSALAAAYSCTSALSVTTAQLRRHVRQLHEALNKWTSPLPLLYCDWLKYRDHPAVYLPVQRNTARNCRHSKTAAIEAERHCASLFRIATSDHRPSPKAIGVPVDSPTPAFTALSFVMFDVYPQILQPLELFVVRSVCVRMVDLEMTGEWDHLVDIATPR